MVKIVRGKNFNQEEIDIIRANYGKITCEEISKLINRSANVIKTKANKLGLKSNLDQSQETHKKINYFMMIYINENNYKRFNFRFTLLILYFSLQLSQIVVYLELALKILSHLLHIR